MKLIEFRERFRSKIGPPMRRQNQQIRSRYAESFGTSNYMLAGTK